MKSAPARSVDLLNGPALTEHHRRFIQFFVQTNDWNEAERLAKLPEGSGRQLMRLSMVIQAIEAARRNINLPQATAAYVKGRWLQLHSADPRELSEKWSVPCRFCWGDEHQYQYNEVELRAALTKHRAAQMRLAEEQRVPFDELGGGGYTINRMPMRGEDYVTFRAAMARQNGLPEPQVETNSDHSCPSCYGHGLDHVVFHDTRTFSRSAATLYRGVKITSGGGIEYLTRDQGQALSMLAKYLGMFNRTETIKTLDPSQMTPDELRAAIAAYAELYEPAGAGAEVPYLPAPSVGPSGK